MKGGSLVRFRPDSKQDGNGLTDILKDVMGNAYQGGLEGYKSSTLLKTPQNIVSGVKRGAKRGLKRGLEKEIQKQARRKLNDIFGE